jgi:hypothetical protein
LSGTEPSRVALFADAAREANALKIDGSQKVNSERPARGPKK